MKFRKQWTIAVRGLETNHRYRLPWLRFWSEEAAQRWVNTHRDPSDLVEYVVVHL